MPQNPFSPEAMAARPPIDGVIRRSITETFSSLPSDRKNAIIAIYEFDSDVKRLHAAMKIGDKWKVGGVIGTSKEKGKEGSVAVEFSW